MARSYVAEASIEKVRRNRRGLAILSEFNKTSTNRQPMEAWAN